MSMSSTPAGFLGSPGKTPLLSSSWTIGRPLESALVSTLRQRAEPADAPVFVQSFERPTCANSTAGCGPLVQLIAVPARRSTSPQPATRAATRTSSPRPGWPTLPATPTGSGRTRTASSPATPPGSFSSPPRWLPMRTRPTCWCTPGHSATRTRSFRPTSAPRSRRPVHRQPRHRGRGPRHRGRSRPEGPLAGDDLAGHTADDLGFQTAASGNTRSGFRPDRAGRNPGRGLGSHSPPPAHYPSDDRRHSSVVEPRTAPGPRLTHQEPERNTRSGDHHQYRNGDGLA